MPEQLDVAIVGAGPYGLSVAAHLPRRTRPGLRRADAHLADAHAAGHAAPVGLGGDLALGAGRRAARSTSGRARRASRARNPIPLQTFLRYADWFRDRFVRENDPSDVAELDRAEASTGSRPPRGRSSTPARSCSPSASPPSRTRRRRFARRWATGSASRSIRRTHGAQRGRRVIVVGGGQGGLESAALAARAGAEVELIVRSRLHWFTEREPYTPRGPVRQRLYRLAYPVVGYGPPPLNRLALHPELFAPCRSALRRRLAAPHPPGRRIALAARSGRRQRPDHRGANRHDARAESTAACCSG